MRQFIKGAPHWVSEMFSRGFLKIEKEGAKQNSRLLKKNPNCCSDMVWIFYLLLSLYSRRAFQGANSAQLDIPPTIYLEYS